MLGGKKTLSFTAAAVIVAIVLMGAALLLAGWTTYAGVRDAAMTLRQGQIDITERAARQEIGVTATSEDLETFLEDHKDDGVRYVAIVSPLTGELQASAGTPVGPPPRPDAGPLFGRELAEIDGRIRI